MTKAAATRRSRRCCRPKRRSAELQAKGMQYNAVAPEELERMRKAAQPVVDKISASLRPETVKLFNEELDRIRKDGEVMTSLTFRRAGPIIDRPCLNSSSRRRRMARILDLYCTFLKGVIAAVPRGHGGAGVRQCRAALRLQLRNHDFGGAVALAAGVAHLPRRHRRGARACASRRRQPGADAAGPRASGSASSSIIA